VEPVYFRGSSSSWSAVALTVACTNLESRMARGGTSGLRWPPGRRATKS
jgi:hypothetical protein